MSFLAIFEVVKKFFTPKRMLYAAIAIVIGILLWKVYDAGIKHEAVKTTEWKGKAQAAQATLKTNQENYSHWSDEQTRTNQAAVQAQKDILADVTAKNDQLQKKLDAAKGVVHEVTKYVTVEADRKCIVPRGFVFMYNHTLGDLSSEFSITGGQSADAPSGLELSEVARVAGLNNAQADHIRGELILWQTWYVKNKAFFDSHPNLPVPVPAN